MTRKKDEEETRVQDRDVPFDVNAARDAALAWFDANGRDFPWRRDPTPYRAWISEIMLQQTTTKTVVGYFERFIERFPNVSALASAEEADVLKYWEGLGYYRRARALREAAIVARDRFQGRVPEERDALLNLPGVGAYTVGAILSFGCDKRAPILEANTTRLNARLLALREETTKASALRKMWALADAWLPQESRDRQKGVYRAINAALTDIGSCLCLPKAPKCGECPLAPFCATKKIGAQDEIPVLRKKDETIFRNDVAVWIARGDIVDIDLNDPRAQDALLLRRPKGALWAGLWDFPRWETDAPRKTVDLETDRPQTREALRAFFEKIGAPIDGPRLGPVLKKIVHSVTKYRVTLHLCRLKGAEPALGDKRVFFFGEQKEEERPVKKARALEPKENDEIEWRWVPIEELKKLPLSSPGRKIASFIEEARR